MVARSFRFPRARKQPSQEPVPMGSLVPFALPDPRILSSSRPQSRVVSLFLPNPIIVSSLIIIKQKRRRSKTTKKKCNANDQNALFKSRKRNPKFKSSTKIPPHYHHQHPLYYNLHFISVDGCPPIIVSTFTLSEPRKNIQALQKYQGHKL